MFIVARGGTFTICAMKLKAFVQSIRETAKKVKSYQLICGNQSGDLDSVISSISYALFADIHDPLNRHIPVLNFYKSDISSRKDLLLVLSQFEIHRDSLLYLDDLPSISSGVQGLVLVDHNKPTSNFNEFQITGIIDHHEDEHLAPDANPRIIQRCGSCSTLVAQYWTSQGVLLTNELVKFLLAPLIIDTSCLKHRAEEPDFVMFKEYQKFIDPLEINSWFEELQSAKFDITGLSMHQIFAKDYKLFEFGVGTDNVLKLVGISSIVKPYKWLVENYSDFKDQMDAYLKQQGLDIFVFMTSFEKDGEFNRELGYVTKDEASNTLMRLALDQNLRAELELDPIDNTHNVYRQLNVAASRKQVAPAIKRALERL